MWACDRQNKARQGSFMQGRLWLTSQLEFFENIIAVTDEGGFN